MLRASSRETQTHQCLQTSPHWRVKSLYEDETRSWSHRWIFWVYPRVVGARSAAGWGSPESSHHPPPLRTTCCSPVRCVRRDLLWPPLLPGFSSLVEILRSSSAQHTHPLYTNGQAAHAYTRTHTHADTCTHTLTLTLIHTHIDAHTHSIDRGSFKKA